MSGFAVVIVESGGIPVTNTENATPVVVTEATGIAITLVDDLGMPVTMLNSDGTPWEPEP